jgi:tetratricopeptide (TPR) repeat protein
MTSESTTPSVTVIIDREFERTVEHRASIVLLRALEYGLLTTQRGPTGDLDRYRQADASDTTSATRDGKELPFFGSASSDGPPASAPASLHRRGLQALVDGDQHCALAYLGEAVLLAPANPEYLRDLGRAFAATGRPADALSALLRSITLGQTSKTFKELGHALHQQSLDAAATIAYREALELDLNDVSTIDNMVDALVAQDDLDTAAEAAELALRLEPGEVDYHIKVGQVRLRRREWARALTAFNRGLEVLDSPGPPTSTQALFTKETAARSDSFSAVEPPAVDPKRATLWAGVGTAHFRAGAFAEAVEAFRRALDHNPRDLEAGRQLVMALELVGSAAEVGNAWSTFGLSLEFQHRFDEAAAAYRQAIARRADCLQAIVNLGRVLAALGQTAEAISCFERALKLDPEHPLAHTELGRVCYLVGQTDRAWQEFWWFCHPQSLRRRPFDQPLWDGTSLTGRTILVWADQELGDTIHSFRYLRSLKAQGAHVIVECQSRLVEIARTLPGVDRVIGRGAPVPSIDVQVPLTLVPIVYPACRQPSSDRVPYLSVAHSQVKQWRAYLPADRINVGLCWTGHPAGINGHARFAPLSAFAPLADVPGVNFVSLQMGKQAAQLLGPFSGLAVQHLQNDTCSTLDTAALMMQLDLIVTVDTMVAHLAGALACPVWLVLPYVADWRWQQEPERTPLYSTIRLFRQTKAGDWPGVFARVRDALQQHVVNARVARSVTNTR